MVAGQSGTDHGTRAHPNGDHLSSVACGGTPCVSGDPTANASSGLLGRFSPLLEGYVEQAYLARARSISRERANELIGMLKSGLPQGVLAVKHWRNRIWVEHHDDHVYRDRRMKVVARQQTAKMTFDDRGDLSTSFQSLSPEFATRYGGLRHRWVNALRFSGYGPNNIATILPFNLFDPDWPPARIGGDRVLVGSEGLIFVQEFKDSDRHVQLLASDQAFIG
jgi:hypothetical protein